MTNYLQEIPELFVQLLLTAVFSLILGLEQRKHHPQQKEQLTFGTDRTFTFIGLLGFALLIADPDSKNLYLAGAFILSLFLSIYYFQKISKQQNYGFTTILLALLTYVMPLVIVSQPHWLTVFGMAL